MDDSEVIDLKMAEEVSQFTEAYSSFSKIVNKIQRQYLSLKEIYVRQSEELQAVNRALQAVASENQAVSELLNNILIALTSGVVAVDKAGRITNLNPAAKRILGIAEESEKYPISDYSSLMRAVKGNDSAVRETLQTGCLIDEVEKTIIGLDGRKRTLTVSTAPLTNRKGEIIGVVELFHDITRLKNMEEQFSRMKVLASLGEMAATIAHEIRNPLGGIGGFAALLSRDLSGDSEKKAMADKVVAGVANINKIIETLLDFARHEEIHKNRVNLEEYLPEILESFDNDYGNGLKRPLIEWDDAGHDKTVVELDTHLFRQALFNLIKNGFESGEDSQVTVRVSRTEPGKMKDDFGDEWEPGNSNSLIRIDVIDDGPGIDENDMDRIFSPFYTTKQNGTGLGLSIAWKIIQGHGGEIRVESKIGQGTKFSIFLPTLNGAQR
ncbi:putative Histidine kinase protein [Candidatus Zixiibacteriota bacterium]|nr:putative Histidine kinase protein [candidate division Zixibacteria bacterium]